MVRQSLALLICWGLWACSAGGPAAVGGGEVGDGSATGGGGPVTAAAIGGPVGGGSNAAGTVSLPAPSSISTEGVETGAHVVCKNVEGPTVECSGSMPSARVGSTVKLSVFPATYAEKRPDIFRIFLGNAWAAGDSVSVIADANGWRANVVAAAGEKIEILLLDPRLDFTHRVVLPVPLVNQQIDWNFNGGMKNLKVDSEGNRFFSLKRLQSLFISEAHAETPGYLGSMPGLITYTGVPLRIEAFVSRPVCEGEIDPPVTDRYKDNYFRIYWQAKGSSERQEISLKGGLQEDVRDIVPFKDLETGKDYLAVALDRVVYVLSMKPNPWLLRKIYFPRGIEKIHDMGNYLYVLQRPNENQGVGEVEMLDFGGKQFYRIEKRDRTGFVAACVTTLETEDLKRLVSSDSGEGAFAWSGLFADGMYRVFGGSGTQAYKLLELSEPVSVQVLKYQDNKLSVALLDAAQKKLRFLQYDLSTKVLIKNSEVNLSALGRERVFRESFNPVLISADRANASLAVLEVSEEKSVLLTMPITFEAGLLQVPMRAQRQDLGAVFPRLLIRDNTAGQEAWIYNEDAGDGYPSQVRAVRASPEREFHLPGALLEDSGDLPPGDDVTD